jgi:hypothetical protein
VKIKSWRIFKMADEECCKKEECECEELSAEEVGFQAHDKIDALINLLVKKKLITEDELEKAYDELFEEDEKKE